MLPEINYMRALNISDDKKISAIQADFNGQFPFLKLEFFHHRHKIFRGSPKNDMVSGELTLAQCRKKHVSGTIHINDNLKVSELEKLFQEMYGLSAQVFRKSGRSWIETTVTDDWSLKQQNDLGKELSSLPSYTQ